MPDFLSPESYFCYRLFCLSLSHISDHLWGERLFQLFVFFFPVRIGSTLLIYLRKCFLFFLPLFFPLMKICAWSFSRNVCCGWAAAFIPLPFNVFLTRNVCSRMSRTMPLGKGGRRQGKDKASDCNNLNNSIHWSFSCTLQKFRALGIESHSSWNFFVFLW